MEHDRYRKIFGGQVLLQILKKCRECGILRLALANHGVPRRYATMQKDHLPIYGVGPLCAAIAMALTGLAMFSANFWQGYALLLTKKMKNSSFF